MRADAFAGLIMLVGFVLLTSAIGIVFGLAAGLVFAGIVLVCWGVAIVGS